MFSSLLQFNPELAAGSFRRFHPGPAAQSFHTFLHNRQADARAGVAFHAVKPLKNAENTLAILSSDANTIVLDPQADEATLFFRPDSHLRGYARGDKLDGIGHQIARHMHQGGTMA